MEAPGQKQRPPAHSWKDLEENFRPFLDAAPDAIIIVNHQGSIVLANPQTPEARPHMIICDVNMPIHDGEGFLVLLKADPELAKVPVLMVTSSDHPTPQTRERLRKAGAVGLLTRPLESSTLLQLIEKALSKSEDAGA